MKKNISISLAKDSALKAPTDTLTFKKARPIAARYGVCAKTIFRWADAGLIHRHKVNDRVVLFDEAEVEQFIKGCRVAQAR